MRIRSIERDEDIEIYLRPHVRSEQRTRDLEHFVGAFDNKHTLAIDGRLRETQRSDVNRVGDGRCLFSCPMGALVGEDIPGAKAPVELEGARLFFPLERADAFNELLRGHWTA